MSKPTRTAVESFLARQQSAQFSYDSQIVSTTRLKERPNGFAFDQRRTSLGRGKETFDRAKAALTRWRHFELGWVSIHDPQAPIQAGTNVAIIVHTIGLWAISAARIVYTIDEPRRFGFAYGTLEDHLECGEERFLVEWTANDEVDYDLSAFSRPHHPFLWLGYPFTRSQQKRFARDSSAAMLRAVDPREHNA